MTDVERLADRIVMIHDGRVIIDTEIDDLRESYSLALLPAGASVSRESLLALGECVGVRQRAGALRAVFRLEPERAREMLHSELDVSDALCTPIVLEEMFIELAGGHS